MGLFCKHNWEILVNETMKSPIEQLSAASVNSRGCAIPSWMFEQKIVVILKCSKCGKLNKTVVKNPD